MLNPQYTYAALLIVQALHLLHHRLAKMTYQLRGSDFGSRTLRSNMGSRSGLVAMVIAKSLLFFLAAGLCESGGG